MSGSASESRDNSFRVNKGVKSPDINNFGHSLSETLLSFSPTTTNSGTEEKCISQNLSVTEQRILIGASSLTGCGALWERVKTGGTWIQQDKMYKNEVKLLALKQALEAFLKAQEIELLHIQMDNIVTLTYFLKMGDKKFLQMYCIYTQIWGLLLRKKATVVAEFLHSALNRYADIESRRKTGSSEWKLALQCSK